MYLIQILLPLYDDEKRLFEKVMFDDVRRELLEKFSGVTAFTQRPADGLWRNEEGKTIPDELVIYEVMTDALEENWWSAYRRKLESKFRQESLVIRSQIIKLL